MRTCSPESHEKTVSFSKQVTLECGFCRSQCLLRPGMRDRLAYALCIVSPCMSWGDLSRSFAQAAFIRQALGLHFCWSHGKTYWKPMESIAISIQFLGGVLRFSKHFDQCTFTLTNFCWRTCLASARAALNFH